MRHKIIADPVYGYLRVDPIPSRDELAEYYLKNYYSESTVFRDFTAEPKKEELEHFAVRCEDILERVEEHFGVSSGLSILDIGCGFGYSVKFFRDKGLDAAGIEPSREATSYAAKDGLNVVRGEIDDFSVAFGKKFDVVLIMDVLEHLREPWRILKYAREELLKPGGLLVVDVPNDFNDFQKAANAEYRLDEWWVVPPIHINYFTVSSIQALLCRCGYAIRGAVSSFPLEMFLMMGENYVGDPETGRRCHNKRVLLERAMRSHGGKDKLRKLYEALAKLELGRQVVVYAVPE